MRNLMLILGFLLSLILTSCQNKINSRRNSFNEQQKDIFHNQNEKFGKRSAKTKGYSKDNTKKKKGNPFSTYSKHDRSTSSVRKETTSKGSSEYNLKKKKVVKKKVLFFQRYKHEKETSTFSGGKHVFRLHIFNRNKNTKPHRHSIFRKNMEKNYKKKKLSPELFDPGMGIRI
jgi:type II secretory pathway pseudopilin PulG